MQDLTNLPKPRNVSPFIKLTRWSLLLCGITYGRQKWSYYHTIQEERRREFEKIRPSLEARKFAEKLKEATEEFKSAARDLDIDLPDEWTAKDFI